jgi:hypothetical protein
MKHINNYNNYNKMKEIKENNNFNKRSILSILRGIGFSPKNRKSGNSTVVYSPDKSYFYGPNYIRLCGIKDKKEAENLKEELSKFGKTTPIVSLFSINGEACHPQDFDWLKNNNMVDVTSEDFLDTERFEFVLLKPSIFDGFIEN